MSFKVIETQEELDAIIVDRLRRQKETLAKEYADYEEVKANLESLKLENQTLKSTLEQNTTNSDTLNAEISTLKGQIKAHELKEMKTKFALEYGLPFNLASRLNGEDEEAIKQDAQSLSQMFITNSAPPPLKNPDSGNGSTINGAYKTILENL